MAAVGASSALGWHWVDPVTSLLVAAWLGSAAWGLLKSSLSTLMDRTLPTDEIAAIETELRALGGAPPAAGGAAPPPVASPPRAAAAAARGASAARAESKRASAAPRRICVPGPFCGSSCAPSAPAHTLPPGCGPPLA